MHCYLKQKHAALPVSKVPSGKVAGQAVMQRVNKSITFLRRSLHLAVLFTVGQMVVLDDTEHNSKGVVYIVQQHNDNIL